jgi:hypothetical protein
MRICDDEHEEIVYNGGSCPLCTALNLVEMLEIEADNYKQQLLEQELDEENEIAKVQQWEKAEDIDHD